VFIEVLLGTAPTVHSTCTTLLIFSDLIAKCVAKTKDFECGNTLK